MKTIKESIIGMRGTPSNNLWLIYPVGKDFTSAGKILSLEYRIYPFGSGCLPVVYCVDTITIIHFFKKIEKFQDEDSRLYMINPEYMKNFGEVEDFVTDKSPNILFTHKKELTILPDPDLNMILAQQKSK